MVHIEKYATVFFTTALHRYRLLNNNFHRLLYHIRAGVSKTSVLFFCEGVTVKSDCLLCKFPYMV